MTENGCYLCREEGYTFIGAFQRREYEGGPTDPTTTYHRHAKKIEVEIVDDTILCDVCSDRLEAEGIRFEVIYDKAFMESYGRPMRVHEPDCLQEYRDAMGELE